MNIYTFLLLACSYKSESVTKDIDISTSNKDGNNTIKNISEYEDMIMILRKNNNNNKPRELIVTDETQVHWHMPTSSQITLLNEVEPTNAAYIIKDDNLFVLYRYIGQMYKNIYVKVIIWRSSNTYYNIAPPEIVEVTDKDPLKND
ncbi:hypothetical protein HZS_1836 [Henneguya salminicola]|nr:hypothetical protein HZS_1836 [Henneguya salminicola]